MIINNKISELRFDLGRDYFCTADLSYRSDGKSRITIFLFLQSLELILSSFIIAEGGYSDIEINPREDYDKHKKTGMKIYDKHGHDILSLYEECKKLDIHEENENLSKFNIFDSEKLEQQITYICNNCNSTIDARFPERGKIIDFLDQRIFEKINNLLIQELEDEYFRINTFN